MPPDPVVVVSDNSPPPESSDDDLEDVALEPQTAAESSREPASDADLASDSDDFGDLEDVDLDDVFGETAPEDQTLTFQINDAPADAPAKKKKRTFVPISKEERHYRKQVHKDVVVAMLCHGLVRNYWCSERSILAKLRKLVSQDIVDMFAKSDGKTLDYVMSRRFIEGLRKLLAVFARKFKSSARGLYRQDWGTDLDRLAGHTSFAHFAKAVTSFRGSRDVGAQAFVAVLRSIGINARLVFSIQTPDYRSLRPCKTEEAVPEEETPPPAQSEFDPVFIPNARQKSLIETAKRGRKKPKPAKAPTASTGDSKHPVFWAEVWNPYSRKWITVDPIVFQTVEVMPMRRKCKLEAPGSEDSCQTLYVIAYDCNGRVRDVTRRYTQYYNAKTVKRRIGFALEEDENWYARALRACQRPGLRPTFAEAVESKEFYDRDVCEGIPNNKADFKNHPVYALESQLRQDEVIYPNDDSSKCGTFKSTNKSTTVPIYKRSHVFSLRTAKAWHMKGRVLKIGAQPLKTKKASMYLTDDSADSDGEVRLYAEFQTELYKPPPIVDGVISKNAFGNVEIFTPWMVPENGALVEVSPTVTLKMLERAARGILGIDYARAIVAFDFGKALKKKGTATAREGGILVEAKYKDAVLAVVEGLEALEDEQRKEAADLNALKSWDFFLKKLQIVLRLNRQHGLIPKNNGSDLDEKEGDEDEDDFSVGSDGQGSDNDNYVPRPSRRRAEATNPEEAGGVFAEENSGQGMLESNDLDDEDGGGFFAGEPHHDNEDLLQHYNPDTTYNARAGESAEEVYLEEEGGFFMEEIATNNGAPSPGYEANEKANSRETIETVDLSEEESRYGIQYNDSE